MKIWNTADFDKLSWHDNYIHGFFSNLDINQITFDIDYITEWICENKNCEFMIAPVPKNKYFSQATKTKANHIKY